MTIISKDKVLLAMAKHAGAGPEWAAEEVARDLCIPVESVLEALEKSDE
jgi:hypothetical protein